VFVGGLIRRLVDRCRRHKFGGKNVTEVELTAGGGKSPEVRLGLFLELSAALYLMGCDWPLAPKLNNPIVASDGP
jgi:hypothetical protein